MNFIERKIFLFFFSISSLYSLAQNHLWAEKFQSFGTTSNVGAGSRAMALDANNNSYVLGLFYDTIKIGTKKVFAQDSSRISFLSKFNANGKCVWINAIYTTSKKSYPELNNVKVISQNRVIIYGSFRAKVLKLSATDSIVNPSSLTNYDIGFVAIYDSLGKCIKYNKTYEGTNYSIGFSYNGRLAIDNKGSVMVSFITGSDTGAIIYKGGRIALNNKGSRNIIVKYSSGLDSVLWYKEFPVGIYFTMAAMRTGGDNNLYVIGTGYNSFSLHTLSFYSTRNKAVLLIISSKGNYIYAGLINSDTKQIDNVSDIVAKDTNNICVLGYVQDSILFQKQWYSSLNKKSKGNGFPYIGIVSTSKGVKWFKFGYNKDSLQNSNNFNGGGKLAMDNSGNIYSTFRQENRIISIGSLTDSSKYYGQIHFVKLDSLGNALWLTSTGDVIDMAVDSLNNLYYCGSFKDSIHLPPINLYSSKFAGFIAKTYDYKIVRGNVSAGPYCAGDAIKVPFSKTGVFDKDNYFIAELSDEEGNFIGKEKELGRLKTNKDSLVIGRLPIFQVTSSGKYRIRIRATKPAVQGFYRFDTLRLLIYSRDKANPGKPETICRGNTIKLNTFGGTKWTWSPKYNMNDSLLRQPTVWPEKTTTYKIIIGDSSGCGSPDTAFKQIIVRQYPKVIFTSSNAILCKNTTVVVSARFEFGDSSHYHSKWFFIDTIGKWSLLKEKSYAFADTINYLPPDYIKDSTRLVILLTDHCSLKTDTAFYTIKIKQKKPKATLSFNDTTICNDSKLTIPAKFYGDDSAKFYWQWYFVSSPKLWFPSNSGNGKFSDTFRFSPTVSKVAIILKDGCTAKADTAYLIITLRKPVTIKSSYRDTTLCTGNLLKYKAIATGGVPKQYRYQWKDLVSNSILSTTDSLKILTKKVLKIQLIVNDGCEALGDTAMFEVKVKPELKAITNLRDTTICNAKTLNYFASATGGTGKTYKFYWLLNGKQIDTINNLQLTINNSSTLSLITKDNCSANDTVKKLITVNPSPKADFSWDLACSRTVTRFTFTGTKPNSPITTIFHWNFNNESPSYLENPSYLFTLSGTKKISLATTSSNGCTDTIKKDLVIKPQSKADFTATDACETDSATFINKSQDATGYNWKFGDGQTTNLQTPKHKYQISSTTTYNVTLVAQVANGCPDSISKAVTINKNPSSDFTYTYNGTIVNLKITKAGNTYQWKFGTTDSVKTTATTYSHNIKSSDQTKVCLTATDVSGCSSQTCKNVSVGISKLSKQGFKLYPNPNSGSFTIEIENPSKDVSIEIFGMLGQLIYKIETEPYKSIYAIDLSGKPSPFGGLGAVRVKNGDSTWNKKVVIH